MSIAYVWSVFVPVTSPMLNALATTSAISRASIPRVRNIPAAIAASPASSIGLRPHQSASPPAGSAASIASTPDMLIAAPISSMLSPTSSACTGK